MDCSDSDPKKQHHQLPELPSSTASPGQTTPYQAFLGSACTFQPSVAPNNRSYTIYPPNSTPTAQSTSSRPVIKPVTGLSNRPLVPLSELPNRPVVQSTLEPSSSGAYRDLVHVISSSAPAIQRPQFSSPGTGLLSCGYPYNTALTPPPVDPMLSHIKHMTETFHAAASSDPVFYMLYMRAHEVQLKTISHPTMVFFVRLHLQIGWIDHLAKTGRQDEIGDTIKLVSERKQCVDWLVLHDKTLKQRVGVYLLARLKKFAPLDFDPRRVKPMSLLLDHLYELETNAFFNPVKLKAPSRTEYRIQVVSYLSHEGGNPQVILDLNISKQIRFDVLHYILCTATCNIQPAQLGYNNGWQIGGDHGCWVYWVDEEEGDGNHELSSDVHLNSMKASLSKGHSILIMHYQQMEIRAHLVAADEQGLGLDRPFRALKPLPPCYTSGILGAYPNAMKFDYLVRDLAVAYDDLPTVRRVRRGERSELGRRRRKWLRKQNQVERKVRAFESRREKARLQEENKK